MVLYHSWPPTKTYTNGMNGIKAASAQTIFVPVIKSVRRIKSNHTSTTATGCKKQTSSSNIFFICYTSYCRLIYAY